MSPTADLATQTEFATFTPVVAPRAPQPAEDTAALQAANAPRRRSADFKTLSVLMPVYNERWTLEEALQRVLAAPVPLELEVIVVDDGSTDGSAEAVRTIAEKEPRVRLLRLDKHQGKGAAIRHALGQMRGDVAVVQDADLEYDPGDYAGLLQPILDGEADAVFGSRFSGAKRRVRSFWHSMANRLLTRLCNLLGDLNLSDMQTCYKMVRADLLRELRLTSRGFQFEAELTMRLAQWGARIYEIPVSYRGRKLLRGKRPRRRDALLAVWEMVRCRFLDTRFTDHTGMYVLRSVDRAQRYNRWVISRVAPFLGRRVVEAGAGIGNLSQLLVDRDHLKLVDHDPMYLAMLQDRFADLRNVHVAACDLERPDFDKDWRPDRLDTVFCSNVLEHLGPHREILESFHRALTPGGHCIIIVPADPRLYTVLDAALGHHRRYRREELADLMRSVGFDVVYTEQMCKAGSLAWLVSGRFLRRDRLTPRQMLWFDRLWPILRPFDYILPAPGMSLIAVGRKRGD